ncbi:MAG: hypothetical protein IIA06_08980 [Proteobacteria bacterium]|nr:hypothetical protein [Pseudomonadota bacterium]
MKNSLEMDDAITIARKVMESLFSDSENSLAKGAERVFNALITARNATQNFEVKDDDRRRIGTAAK